MASLPIPAHPPAPADLPDQSQTARAHCPAELALRAAMAALFLAVLAVLLRVLAPFPPVTPQHVDLSTPIASTPALPDPAALVALSAQAARDSNAAMPIAEVPEPAAPFLFPQAAEQAHDRARDCLAAAAWFEAGDDPSGERAVVQVVLNRVRHPAFAPTVCGVVFQGAERQTGCQFTFTCDHSLATRRPGPAAWARARAIAGAALAGAVDPRVGWATHYHADYVVPKWRDSLTKVAQVGLHVFYRWQGWWGTAPAFRRGAADRLTEPVEAALAALSSAHDAAAPITDETALAGLIGDDQNDLTGSALSTPPPVLALAPQDNTGSAVPAPEHVNLMAMHGKTTAEASEDTAIRLAFDPALFPGRYAIQALDACGHRARCTVLGWRGAEGGLDTLAFAYRRDRASGGEGVWWDCAITPRSDKAQCLPPAGQRQRFLAVGSNLLTQP